MSIPWRQDARTVIRFIDSLPPEGVERDAIVEHPDPTYDGREWWSNGHDCGCLIGCVVEAKVPASIYHDPGDMRDRGLWRRDEARAAESAGYAFPRLTRAYTPQRVWRFAKERASRTMTPSLPTPPVVHPERVERVEVGA